TNLTLIDGPALSGVSAAKPAANQVILRDSKGESQSMSFGSEYTVGVALADFDGDGDIDAFLANSNGTPDRVWLNRNPGEVSRSPVTERE
ncbi:MAG: FG-GAP repeat domain-containing protein, partial [Planctomycetales bacterium]